MKKIYLGFIFLSSICYSQDDLLLGEWTMNSFFEFDVFYENPSNPITIEINSNSITIQSYCGNTYLDLYTTSTAENTIEITEANWDIFSCSEDNVGWETAISLLFNINDGEPKDLTYSITDDGTTTYLELSHIFFTDDDTPVGVTGYFTKINTSNEEIVDNWYLKSVTTNNGSTYYNVYNNLPITFTNEIYYENYLGFTGSSACNSFGGEYILTDNEITIIETTHTLLDCYNQPNGIFDDLYLSVLTNNYTYPSVHSYEISGSGDEQTLTLSNSNGDSIVYQKTETNAILNRTWYLQTVSDNDTTYSAQSTESPSITIGLEADPFFDNISFNGTGVCNTFNGDYYIYQGDGDEINIDSFTPTTNICEPSSDFENAYFSILSDESVNTFGFEIINNGENLILTSITDDEGRSANDNSKVLSFSKEALSVNDFDYNANSIRIVKNPVEDQILLNFDDNLSFQNLKYTIFNLEGKLIFTSELTTTNIEVHHLLSGLYFINFSDSNNTLTTLKFVKK
ncbi:META domain-containing protein [Winogradskyella psychrotolerans]|uniref:META domain-containing protein n=1 Tax=Winogradskyella psychrotolerans TaxID=1344585 RepID=UPI001C07490A|nr:META domain-containing protein [Winogradskyella psychrotolerans]MBU2927208.1 META domain-containing protein [Winogradskyella psychrotolerans]